MNRTLKTIAAALLLVTLWTGCSSPPPVPPPRSPFEQAKSEWFRGSPNAMEALAWGNDQQAQAWLADMKWRNVEYDASCFWAMKAARLDPTQLQNIHHLHNSEGYQYVWLVGNKILSTPLPQSPTNALEKAAKELQQQWGITRPKQNFEPAFTLLMPLAEQGNSVAQTALGQIYLEGKPPYEKDPEKALYWFNKAADQDNPDALALLGTMYLEGFNVTKDIPQSIQYLEQSVKAGHPYSSMFLAKANGLITDQQRALAKAEKNSRNDMLFVKIQKLYDAQEYEKAFTAWHQLAMDGHRPSQLKWMECQLSGTGTEQNFGSTITTLQEWRNEGKLDAMLLLGKVYETGIGTEIDLSQAKKEYARAAEKHQNWKAGMALARIERAEINAAAAQQPEYEESARGIRLAYGNQHYEQAYLLCENSNGRYDTEAKYVLGLMLYYGNGTIEQNKDRGFILLGEAADNNHDEAMLTRANILLENNDTTIEAARLIYNAAARGNTEAQYQWGVMCLEGYRTPLNNKEAVRFLTMAAEKEYVEAIAKLGDIYHTGRVGTDIEARVMRLNGATDQNPNYIAQSDYKAKQWWEKAAAKGHGNSAYNLGINRESVSDTGAAAAYYEIAVLQNHTESQYRLGMLLRKDYVMDVEEDWKRGTELLELAKSRGHELATLELEPEPEVVADTSVSWKDQHRARTYGGVSGQSAAQAEWKSNYKPYDGPKPWTQEYQKQRIMKDPTLGFQNRYNY